MVPLGLMLAVGSVAAEVTVVKDLPYYEGEGATERQRLDLYLPLGDAPPGGWPVFVFVHGGGWVMGDRGLYGNVGRAVAGDGVLGVCISYRLSPEVRHPAHVTDVCRALHWVHDRISEHDGDPARVCIGGHSAGAHLTSLLTLDPQYLAAAGLEPSFVRGVAAMSGVYDLAHLARLTWMRQTMLEPAFGTDPQVWAAASPLQHVHRGAPPFWVNNAEMDWGLLRDAETFVGKLRDDGVDVQRSVTPNANHITVITQVGQPDDPTTARLLAFVHRVTGVKEVAR